MLIDIETLKGGKVCLNSDKILFISLDEKKEKGQIVLDSGDFFDVSFGMIDLICSYHNKKSCK